MALDDRARDFDLRGVALRGADADSGAIEVRVADLGLSRGDGVVEWRAVASSEGDADGTAAGDVSGTVLGTACIESVLRTRAGDWTLKMADSVLCSGDSTRRSHARAAGGIVSVLTVTCGN